MAATLQQNHVTLKAHELGISEEIINCALHLIYENRNLVNAIDNRIEMDDYIYRAILKQAVDKRKSKAEENLYHSDAGIKANAEKDLSLHAEEASAMVLELANFKRRHRATSITEIIVKRCVAEIEGFVN
jgi:hypothetical protein